MYKIYDEYNYLYDNIDCSAQITDIYSDIFEYIKTKNITKVVDLGCGEGTFLKEMYNRNMNIEYFGVDVYCSDSMKSNPNFLLFDGINLPFDNSSQKYIISRQVFEHVRNPYELFSEISRVLSPDGILMGSCSGIEPMHGCSVFNFTPFGIKYVFENSGLELLTISPGAPADIVIQHHSHSFLNKEFQWSLTSKFITDIENDLLKREFDQKYINYMKLIFSGHIKFMAKKHIS